jgi:Carboxypeptidase regulatory-like domain/TonB dependent receptor-like, beta-barrel
MNLVRRFLILVMFSTLPAMAFAQEATLTGTITDATGGVLPGVTVTAVNEATGNTFTGVTDERGIYRIALRVGTYRMSIELQGFTTVQRTGVQLLVGQTASINAQMSPSTVQETVTVTAEAPLLNVTTSSLGGNVDPTQVQELPVNGRNWMALALLAPGSRTSSTNATTPLPDRNDGENREFQLNVDGQQVSAEIGAGGQPRYSQDSIAEFQFLSNRFDATLGRSSGVQVNVVTKSGTNELSGLLRGNFRDDSLNAEHPVLDRVVPINNQQISVAGGGPIIRDKLHYFGNYEYEREPRSSIWNTPFPAFNIEINGKQTQKMGGLRADYQLSPSLRLMGKGSAGRFYQPFGAGTSNNHPAATNDTREQNDEGLGQLTHVLSSRALNEVKVGYSYFKFANAGLTQWSNHWQRANGITNGSPRIQFTGFNNTPNQYLPRYQDQRVWSIRDDFTFSYDAAGRHDLRSGVEYLDRDQIQANCRQCGGVIDARGGPRPADAALQAIFPDAFNVDTWNLAALSPITRSYVIGVGDFIVPVPSQKFGTWVQDDWRVSDRLTLNLGVRYDLGLNIFANDIEFLPWQRAGRPNDTNNVQPRVGFAWQLNPQTVIRGGTGLYYGDALGGDQSFARGNVQIAQIRLTNDGRANFAADPLNGRPLPSLSEALDTFCHVNNRPGCLIRDALEVTGPPDMMKLQQSWQNSIGFQRQFGQTMAFEADYIYTRGRDEKDVIDNVNLTYNPATGVNYPFSDVARRPFPEWGVVSMMTHNGRSEYHALQTAFTKRYSNNWQGSVTYTLASLKTADSPPVSGIEFVPFATQADLGGQFGPSADDQRHRLVFNGIWQVGGGFQLSAMHFMAAGIRMETFYGGDLRQTGADFSQRLRQDGSIVPLNSVFAPAQNRTDLRLQQRVPLPGPLALDGIWEVFNVFNRPNYLLGNQESASDYLDPVNGQFRSMQLGFRLTF